LGAADAQRWLDRHPRLWCSDASHDLDVDPSAFASAHDQHALDEFRLERRRR
jgi:NTE family protein